VITSVTMMFFVQLQLAPLSSEMSREEMHMGDSSSGGGASPLTARSLRLERVAQALAHSQEELRRFVFLRIRYELGVILFNSTLKTF
jgi:hypothetical protein